MDAWINKLLKEIQNGTFRESSNRGIGRNVSTSQPSYSAALSQGSSHVTNQFPPWWQSSKGDEYSNPLSKQSPHIIWKNEPLSAKTDLKQLASVRENQKQLDSSYKVENILSFEQKSSQDNFHLPKLEQNWVPTYDLESKHQGQHMTLKSEHQVQLMRIQTASSPQVRFPAMNNRHAVHTTMSNPLILAPEPPATSNSQAISSRSSNQQVTSAVNHGKHLSVDVLIPSVLPSNSVSPTTPNQIKPSKLVNSNFPSASPATASIMIGSNAKAPAKKSTIASNSKARAKKPAVGDKAKTPAKKPTVGKNAKAPAKMPTVGQKKPLEDLLSSLAPSSKKQKVSKASCDQSVEHLIDVTAVSGVDLREEEEQLFSVSKEDSHVSEAFRRVVQEDDWIFLEKVPLQQKLKEIVSKCGLNGFSSDVERCLSLCVEERMRGLIDNLIRISKQRLDIETRRHRTIVTSGVRRQIMIINQKVRDEWEKEQAEAEKLQRLNESECNPSVDGEKEKDDLRVKPVPNEDQYDKMRIEAANIAARASVGGDDFLSKWRLMDEKNRQKRALGADAVSGLKPGSNLSQKLFSSSKSLRHSQETEKGANLADFHYFFPQGVESNSKVARIISVKDVISALEREHQMSKSTLMHRLYENSV